ncbi:PadR family transcriptional regulator (plasmid) [Streptomyces sp. Qhu-G9]|uniref:PadR family transcriptional regulator n=1 Tax=Streptomyces sp. Qhu-G9 TaxID=3452799 RepID=UPI0022AC54D2|nr:PadR family transcriptional regulator [Streptomyces aurantiacus]WAU78382.1 PadR family transcriptional regulator [Streptomyces aurantiacus]
MRSRVAYGQKGTCAVPIRITTATSTVLHILLEDPTQAHYGFEICEKTGLLSGTVYPVLARLESHGWLESSWEEQDETEPGLARPIRRYYRFSVNGAAEAQAAMAKRRVPIRYAPEGEAWTS